MTFSALGSYRNIVIAQVTVSFFAWIAFAGSVAPLFSTRSLRCVLVFMLVVSEMFRGGYYNLDRFGLSDSFALASVLLWFAGVVRFDRFIRFARQSLWRWGWVAAAFLAVVWYASSARDTNAYLLPFGLVLIVRHVTNAALSVPKKAIVASIAIVAVAGICVLSVKSSEPRTRLTLANVFGQRILPFDERANWFRARGLPDTPLARQFSGHPAFYFPRWQEAIGDYLAKQGRQDYTLYLLTHPRFLLGGPLSEIQSVLNQSFSGQVPERVPLREHGLGRAGDPYAASAWLPFPLLLMLSVFAFVATFLGPGLLRWLPLVFVFGGISNCLHIMAMPGKRPGDIALLEA